MKTKTQRPHSGRNGVLSLIGVALAAPAIGHSQIVQTVNSAGTSSDWNHAIWGTPAAAPSAGNTYVTAPGFFAANNTFLGYNVTGRVRSYGTSGASGAGSGIFAGDSLQIVTDTELLMKAGDTTANLVLNGGTVRYAPDTAVAGSLSGTISLTADSYLGVVQSSPLSFTVNSSISGSDIFYLRAGQNGGHSLIFDGDLSGFDGTFNIGGGNSRLTVNFNQDYSLSAGMVMGTYATADVLNLSHNLTLDSFTFGTTSLSPGTYDSTILDGMFGNGSQFTGAGSLTVVPEPSAAALASLAGLTLLLRCRRKH